MKPPRRAARPMRRKAGCVLALGLAIAAPAACSKKSVDQGALSASAGTPLFTYWIGIHCFMEQLPDHVYGLHQISAYPTEPAMTMLSAYLVTGNPVFRQDTEDQLQFAHSLENSDHLLVIPKYPWVSRDYQARHIYNLALAGMLLKEPTYVRWADDCAQAMVDHLSRVSHLDRDGVVRTIFYNTYETAPPYQALSPPGVSPNQNAGVGLAFTLLYHMSQSSLYDAGIAREIALAELHASAAYQTSLGEIALTDGDPLSRFDTNYGSYTALLWLFSNEYWQDSTLSSAISHAAMWLSRSDLLVSATSGWEYPAPDYATLVIGQARYPECWSRLLLYWKTSIITSGQRRLWADECLRQVYELSSSQLPSGATPFCYFQFMGMPEEEYLPGH